MKKILSLIKYVIFAVSLVLLVLVFVMGAPDYKGVDIILKWTYFLTGAAILCAIVFPMINLASNPKGAMRALVGVGIVAVVVIVSWVLSSSEPMPLADGTVYDNTFGLKITDTQLYTAYFAFVAAILAAVGGEIYTSVKK